MNLDGIKAAIDICDMEIDIIEMEWSGHKTIYHRRQTAENIKRLLLDELEMCQDSLKIDTPSN